jgi:uncharacterized protein (DUF427 family)
MDGHRIELHSEPRTVEVSVDGVVVASSERAVVLEETGLPARYYLPPEDVRVELLEATPTETVCPFKGQASYWSVRTPTGEHRDIAWSYATPLESVAGIAGLICFYAERTDHAIDGVAQERPVTPWTPQRA